MVWYRCKSTNRFDSGNDYIVLYSSVSQPGFLGPLEDRRELPGFREMAGENRKKNGKQNKVSVLTMKTTKFLLVYLLYIYTHHVNTTINLLAYNDRKMKTNCKAPRLPYTIVSQ